jgi:hypothetical protein
MPCTLVDMIVSALSIRLPCIAKIGSQLWKGGLLHSRTSLIAPTPPYGRGFILAVAGTSIVVGFGLNTLSQDARTSKHQTRHQAFICHLSFNDTYRLPFKLQRENVRLPIGQPFLSRP